MATAGDLVVNLTGKTTGLTKALNRGRSLIGGFTGGAIKGLGAIGLAAQGAQSIFSGLKNTLGKSISLAADFEQAEVAFTTMLGSAKQAKTVLGDLQRFSASTPFQLPELRDSAKLLLANKLPAEELIGTMKVLGDISAGSGGKLIELTRIFNKMRATGRVSLENLNELMLRNIPIYDILGKQLNVSKARIREMASTGKISFEQMTIALQGLTEKGGLFENSMKKQSGTLAGVWSTMKDNFTLALAEVGKAIAEAFDFKGAVTSGTDFIKYFRATWLPQIKTVINSVAETFKLLSFGFRNFGLLMELVWVHIKTWGLNVVTLLKNLAMNGLEIFGALGKGIITVFINVFELLKKNATKFGKGLWRAIRGKGFSFRFEGGDVLGGARADFQKAGEGLTVGIKSAKPEAQKVIDEIARREAARRKKIADAQKAVTGKLSAGAPDQAGGGGNRGTIEGALAGTSAFFQRVSEIRNRRGDRQLKEQQKTNDLLTEIKINTRPGKPVESFEAGAAT